MVRTARVRLERFLWVFLYLASPIIPLSAYFAGNWFSFFHSWSLSMTFGIIGYVWYLNQFIIAARPSYWDRLYGLDRMYAFHGHMAIVATLFVIAHVVIKRITFPVFTVQQALGAGAVVIFVVVIVATLLFMVESYLVRLRPLRRLKRYAAERWRWQYHHLKRFHNLVVVAAFLVLAHVLLAFSTLESFLRVSIMALWFVVAVGLYGWHKMIKPARAKKRPFRVIDVVAENDEVTTVRLSTPEGRSFRYKPGQFAYFRFLADAPTPEDHPGTEEDRPEEDRPGEEHPATEARARPGEYPEHPGTEEHPFTLSSAPGEDSLAVSAKALGDFSAALRGVRRGAPVLVDGPYGVFRSDRTAVDTPLIFIAGGIGITPFLSMIGAFANNEADRSRSIHLIWSIRTPDDLCMLDRLESARAALPNLSVETFVSRATREEELSSIPAWIARSTGRIDVEALVQRGLVGTGREFYLCGPRAMMESLISGLRRHGIPGKQIHFEAFAM